MRMKNILLTGIAVLLVVAMTGCDLATGSVSGPPQSQYEDAASNLSGILDTDDDKLADDQFSITTGTALPDQAFAEDQTLTIAFQNGVVDEDALSALAIYPLSDPDETYQAWDRGAAISATTTVFETGGGDSEVVITVDLSSASSNRYEVVFGGEITANGGALNINEDGDLLGGEAEDEWVGYFDVTTGTPPTSGYTAITPGAGQDRDPQANVTAALQYYNGTALTTLNDGDLVDQNTIPSALYVTFTPPTGSTGNTDFDSVTTPTADLVSLERLVDGEWTDIGATFSLVSAVEGTTVYATYSVTPGTALENGGLYRVRTNQYWITDEWNGYPLSLNGTNQFNLVGNTFDTRFNVTDADLTGANDFVTVSPAINVASVSNGVGYIDVDVDNGGATTDLDASTVTADLFEVVNNSDNRQVAVSSIAQRSGPASTEFRLYLETDLQNDGGDSVTVYFYPGAVDEGADDTTDNDNLFVIGGSGTNYVGQATSTF